MAIEKIRCPGYHRMSNNRNENIPTEDNPDYFTDAIVKETDVTQYRLKVLCPLLSQRGTCLKKKKEEDKNGSSYSSYNHPEKIDCPYTK